MKQIRLSTINIFRRLIKIRANKIKEINNKSYMGVKIIFIKLLTIDYFYNIS